MQHYIWLYSFNYMREQIMLYTFGNLMPLCNIPLAGGNKCKIMEIYGQKSYFMAVLKIKTMWLQNILVSFD